MLLVKGLGIVSPSYFLYDFSKKMFITGQISLSHCLYLQLFDNQVVTSQTLKLTLFFNLDVIST